jgi:hypothetical protein
VNPDAEKRDAQHASVFAVRDQGEVIAQIDSVSEDDLASTFFGDSIADVEGAATRMFDVGIRTLAHDAPPAAHSGAFAGEPTGSPGTTAAGSPAARAAERTSSARLKDDMWARRAFILGGPAALA